MPLITLSAQQGFTMIELMVTVSILALLMAIAAPSFTPLIEAWRVRQATEQLRSTLNYARSEAIKRGGRVAIQKLPNNTNGCKTATSTDDWDCGWFVCEDTNGNGACSASEPVLQREEVPPNLQITRKSGGASIKFNRWGLVDGKWPGFSLVPVNKSLTNPAARGVCMSSGGRIQVIPPEAIPCTG